MSEKTFPINVSVVNVDLKLNYFHAVFLKRLYGYSLNSTYNKKSRAVITMLHYNENSRLLYMNTIIHRQSPIIYILLNTTFSLILKLYLQYKGTFNVNRLCLNKIYSHINK